MGGLDIFGSGRNRDAVHPKNGAFFRPDNLDWCAFLAGHIR
ncbi:Uncharacterised protein [Vibrio cholerae]|nr:Uncharacterised protein [Vibrio cholerae]